MNYGTSLKTKIDPDKNNTDGAYFLYLKPNGTHIGTVGQSMIVGTYERIESYFFTDYYYVKLAKAAFYNGKTYQYAYVKAQNVFAYSPTLTKYYAVNTSVNIRATPGITGKILGQLRPRELAGTSDGTKSNGFLSITRPDGTAAWVSANYLTTAGPVDSSSTDGTGSQTDSTSDKGAVYDPADQTQDERNQTALENTVGDGFTTDLRWMLLGIAVCLFGALLVRFLVQRRNKAKQS